jgi:hypothetical protein
MNCVRCGFTYVAGAVIGHAEVERVVAEEVLHHLQAARTRGGRGVSTTALQHNNTLALWAIKGVDYGATLERVTWAMENVD